MFNLFKPKQPKSQNNDRKTETLKLSGLHCSSCAVNIDLALEDLLGVKATTNYAKSESKIDYDPKQTTLKKIHSTIQELGYTIV